MAAKIDRYLGSVQRGLQDLSSVLARRMDESRMGAESDDQLADRLSFQDEWWDLMDRLDVLRAAYEGQQMSPAQRQDFETLCPAILSSLSLMQHLDLRLPSPLTIETAQRVAGQDVVTRTA